MRIRAFGGVRYDPAGDPGSHAAPPFDQIDPELAADLRADRRHFSRLTRPVAGPESPPEGAAAALYRDWLGTGVVRRDDEPSLYPYEILLAGGGRRLGLTALVELDEAAVQPHEQTVDRTVAERLALLRATGADLEPILLLAEDQGALDGWLGRWLESAPAPLVEHRAPDGHVHRLYRVTDPDRLAELSASLAASHALIADGHHRWRTALSYRRELGAAAAGAATAKLAVLTSITSDGVTIDPIHRGLAGELHLAAAPGVAARSPLAGSGAEMAARVAAAAPAIGVLRADGGAEVWRLDDASPLPRERAALAVCRLHEEILPALGVPPGAATDGTIHYRSDPGTLARQVAAGELAIGFLLPPIDPDAFARAMASGQLTPPKATRFLPKLVSGLVWADDGSALL